MSRLENIRIDADHIDIAFTETTERSGRLICEGYLGYELAGFWDEMIIEAVELTANGPFLARCLTNLADLIGANPSASGRPVRNRANPMELSSV